MTNDEKRAAIQATLPDGFKLWDGTRTRARCEHCGASFSTRARVSMTEHPDVCRAIPSPAKRAERAATVARIQRERAEKLADVRRAELLAELGFAQA